MTLIFYPFPPVRVAIDRIAKVPAAGGLLNVQHTVYLSLKLVEYTQGYGLDNKLLARDLQEQLHVICVTSPCSRNRSDIKLDIRGNAPIQERFHLEISDRM